MEDDFGPRTTSEPDYEETDNPLHLAAEHTVCGYQVSAASLPSGTTAVAWRASASLADRVTDYPDKLAERPGLADGALVGTVWVAADDTPAWICTAENGLFLPKKHLVAVDAQGDPLTSGPGSAPAKQPLKHRKDARKKFPGLAKLPGVTEEPPSASTTSEPPLSATTPSLREEPEIHEAAARAQAGRALAVALEGLEGILPASRALFRPMGLANGRPRWCQPEDVEQWRTFDQSRDVSPAEHKLFEGAQGLQLYYFPPNAKWFVATHFEPRRDSAFAWVQADGAVPQGPLCWKVQGPYDGEKWSQVTVRVRELLTEEDVERYEASAYLDELVDCAKRTDAIRAQARRVRRCGFMLSGHPQKSFNGLYRPRNIEDERPMRWPALEHAFGLLKRSFTAQATLDGEPQVEEPSEDSTGNAESSADTGDCTLDAEEVAALHLQALRAIELVQSSDRCLPPAVDALEIQARWLRMLLGVEVTPPASEAEGDLYALEYAGGSEDGSPQHDYWPTAGAIEPELAPELQGGAMMQLDPDPEPEPEPEIEPAGIVPGDLEMEEVDTDAENGDEDLDVSTRAIPTTA